MAEPTDLDQVETAIGYRFTDRTLLEAALTHASVEDLRRRNLQDYDRLEFLGDRVVGLIVASELHRRFAAARAGELALRYNAIVRRETLAAAARDLGLGPFIRLSRSERQAGGEEKPAVLADVFEAVVGAIYCDGGLEPVRRLFEARFADLFASGAGAAKDPKTALQETTHARGLGQPEYGIADRSGPDHEPVFSVVVRLPDGREAAGEGRSKREAEQAAARRLLDHLAETK